MGKVNFRKKAWKPRMKTARSSFNILKDPYYNWLVLVAATDKNIDLGVNIFKHNIDFETLKVSFKLKKIHWLQLF